MPTDWRPGIRCARRGAPHGAVQFDWGFDGYGESLIDYKLRATYIGLGMSLMEWY